MNGILGIRKERSANPTRITSTSRQLYRLEAPQEVSGLRPILNSIPSAEEQENLGTKKEEFFATPNANYRSPPVAQKQTLTETDSWGVK
ncbi:hypothetical protein MUK42_34649 [Musa troglodytarum]|nr:hypothetical protein MUK42_34649 [Musa troglodytarum]